MTCKSCGKSITEGQVYTLPMYEAVMENGQYVPKETGVGNYCEDCNLRIKNLTFNATHTRTLAGITMEVSVEAPQDRIVMHPEVYAHVCFAMDKLSVRTYIEVSKEIKP